MGIIKTFSEWLNESYSSVRTLTNNVYQAIVDAGLGDNFYEPKYNDESPYLTAQADAYGFEITDQVDCIPFSVGSTFDYDKYIFYSIYVTDEAPINDEGDTASVIIEYGEDDYTDGPEPWVLYYSAKEDHWDGNGPIKNPSSELANLICVISQAINPETKYHSHRTEKTYDILDNKNCTVDNLYNYLIKNYKPIGDKEIVYTDNKEIEIPITLSDEPILITRNDVDLIFSIECPLSLKEYIDKTEYGQYSFEENGILEIIPQEDDDFTMYCSSAVKLLDTLLDIVPNPALRRL